MSDTSTQPDEHAHVDPRKLPEGQEYATPPPSGTAPNGDPLPEGATAPEPPDPSAPLKVLVNGEYVEPE